MATRIPINKDDFGFEDKQDDVWARMEQDMERRRREWQNEIDNMSKDFFQIRTDKDRTFGALSDTVSIPSVHSDGKSMIEKDDHGNPVFKASFNVKDFKPEEISVKMDANKITVQAKHEEKCEGKSISREFCREMNIPGEIDPMALQCKLGPDGVLIVEAPFPVPNYDKRMSSPLAQKSTGHSTNVSVSPFQQQSAFTQATPSPVHSVPFRHSPPPPPHHTSTATHFMSGHNTTARSASPKSASPRNMSPITVIKDKMFKLEVDIEDFSPEELTVKTQDNKLSILARREIRTGTRKSSKEISREFLIPDNVDPMTIKAFFTDGSKLVVEAPYKNGPEDTRTSETTFSGATLTGR